MEGAEATLVDYIRQEAAIQLHEEDVELSRVGSAVTATLLGTEVGTFEVDEDADASDVAMAVMEGVGDVRAVLVQIRLGIIRRHFPAFGASVAARLVDSGWDDSAADALTYEVEEDSSFGAPEEGWPAVRVVVTSPGGRSVRVPGTANFPAEPAEPADVAAAVREGLEPESGS